MSDWQPAVLVNAHGNCCEEYRKVIGKVVGVIQASPIQGMRNEHVAVGCDATEHEWYMVNPKDVRLNDMTLYVCKYEILTD